MIKIHVGEIFKVFPSIMWVVIADTCKWPITSKAIETNNKFLITSSLTLKLLHRPLSLKYDYT